MILDYRERILRLSTDFLLGSMLVAFGYRFWPASSLAGLKPLAIGLMIICLLLTLALKDVSNWNLGLFFAYCFATGVGFRIFLPKQAVLPLAQVLSIGTVSLGTALISGQVLCLESLALRKGIWASSWLYIGIWILMGLGFLNSSIQASLSLAGLLLFWLASALWSFSLKRRHFSSAPALALELNLLFVNILIAVWALRTA